MARMVNCVKLKTEAEGLDFPPYPGPLGKQLWESVSKQAWKEWLEHQKRLVNENRLNLADARGSDDEDPIRSDLQEVERHLTQAGRRVAKSLRSLDV